jgi:biopolymer transport protein ExbB
VLYVDGVEAARAAGGVPTLATAAVIGADAGRNDLPPSAPAQKDDVTAGKLSGFKGELDELQISNVERPAGWLQLVAIIQGTDPSRALSAGQDEESGAGGGTFTILMKSVTLDGWIVIGLLGIMALVSISVMVRKVLTLNEAQAANRRFTKQYRQASVDFAKLVEATTGLSPLGDEGRLRSSPLYKLLRICVEETRKRTGRGHALSAQAIESIRAGLDAELVRQGQELNSQMVLLTIAISGGPFLGLLGTVVGVMIVFASIAAAGDVNVNAIAPGIAAALVATVAGLAVAIPSLFGYNWLLIQIRSLLATHHVFVDELVTRLAEEHAEPSIRKLALAVAPAAGQ